jgi:hypothetical protein
MAIQNDTSTQPKNSSITGMPPVITFTIPEENLHVMPREYQAARGHVKRPAAASGSNKRFFLLIGGLAIVLGAVIVGLLLYVRSQQNPAPAAPAVVDTNTNQPTPVATTTPSQTTDVSAQTRDATRVKDIVTIRQALAAYFDDFMLYPNVIAGLPQKYLLVEPKDPATAQGYGYSIDLNGQSYRLQFVSEGEIIFDNKTLPAGLHVVGPDGLLSDQTSAAAPTPTPTPTIPVTVSGNNKDTDNDGLTTSEEISFRTDPANADTDGDGYKDGEEVINLFSPIAGQRAYLNISGLVRLYTNTTYGYSTWLPQDWIQRSLDSGNQEIVLTSPTGDSIDISIETNSQNTDAAQWYAATFGSAAATAARHVTIAGLPAIESADGLSWYLSDQQRIYKVSYDAATSGVIQYPAVFILVRETFSLASAQ